jgi:hypothetical protein
MYEIMTAILPYEELTDDGLAALFEEKKISLGE